MTKYKKYLFKSISLFILVMLVATTTSSTTYAASQTATDSKVSNTTTNTETLGVWTKKTDLPKALGGHSSLVVDGKVYIFGGNENLSKSKYNSSVYTYDPTTDNWVKKTDMPKALTAHSSVVLNGIIYIMGGFSENGPTSSVYSYDPNTNTWTEKANMPQTLLGHASVVFNNKIYIIGGYNGKNDVSSVYAYDPTTNTWTQKSNDLESTGSPSAVVFDNKIYVTGGSIRVYDPNTNTWTKKIEKLANQSSSTNSLVLNDKIYILGGSLSPYVTEYNPNTNTISKKSNMLSDRSNHSSVVFDNKIYTFGGSNGKKFISDVDVYDVASKATPTYMQLNKKSLNMEVGKSETLTAKILPENVDNKKIEWSSSDKTIASVDQNGLVTSLKEGSVIITATSQDGKLTANCRVTIKSVIESLGAWIKKADMPKTLGKHSAVTLDGKIYVLGGNENHSNSKCSSSVYVYDSNEDNWTKKTDMPKAIMSHSSVTIDGKIYVLGGYSDYRASNSVYEYNVNADTWTKKANMPKSLLSHSSVIFDGKIYVLGGYDWNNPNYFVYVYDISKDTWTQKSDSPLGSAWNAAAVAYGNKIYVFGGVDSKNLIRVYDPNTDTWTQKDIKSICQSDPNSAVVLYNKIYLLGNSLNGLNLTTYDPDTDTFTKKADMLSASCNHTSVVLNNKIYALGGGNGIDTSSTVEEYDEYGVTDKIMPTSLQINKKDLDLELGKSESLTANLLPENASNKKLYWYSSDSNIVTVDKNGLITSLKEGTAIITVTSQSGNLKDSCTVNVKSTSKNSILLDKTNIDLEVGQFEFIYHGKFEDLNWISSDPSIVKLSFDSNSYNTVTALKEGTVTITATSKDGKLNGTCKVNVKPTSKTGISLDKTSLNLEVGKYDSIKGAILPEDNKYSPLSWSSSDPSIVSIDVDDKCYVNGKKEGTAIITATSIDGKFKATCTVNVNSTSKDSILLDKTNIDLEVGQWEDITAKLQSSTYNEKDLEWSLDDTNIVALKNNLWLKSTVCALKEGTAKLKAYSKDGKLSSTCTINVKPSSKTGISLSKTTLELNVDEFFKLEAKILPEDTKYEELLWSSSDESIVCLDSWRLGTTLCPRKEGTAIITATSIDGKLKATCTVNVKSTSKDSILLDKTNIELEVGQREFINHEKFEYLNWTSSDPSIAKLSEDYTPFNTVTALKEGTVTITATSKDGKSKATCTVRVKPSSKTGISLNKTTLTLEVGQEDSIDGSILPEDNKYSKLLWSCSDPSIVYIDVDDKCYVRGEKEGTVIITATSIDGKFKATCTVNVKSTSKDSILLDKTNIELEAGQWSSIDTNKHQDFTWVSSDPSIAKLTYVDGSSNSITALKDGNATITVTSKDGKEKGTCNITVKPTSKTGISLDKTTLDIKVGEHAIISGTILPKDDEYALLSWSSSDPTIVDVASDGKCYLSGEKEGTAIVTATSIDGKFKATCTVNVKSPNQPNKSNISLDKTSVDLQAGECVELVATVLDSNYGDLEWSSSDESIASLYYTGAKALIDTSKPGTATITVSSKDGKLKASCVINVKPLSKNKE